MKKALAFLTASVMALGSLPFLSVGAESFAPGDVDMDGVITGHDTALVSRHLVYGDNNLSEEQLKLADYNGDGVVNQTDVEAIHENEVWKLGDVDMNGRLNLDDALAILQEYSCAVAGRIVGKLLLRMRSLMCRKISPMSEEFMQLYRTDHGSGDHLPESLHDGGSRVQLCKNISCC